MAVTEFDGIKILKASTSLLVGAGVANIVREFVSRVAPTDTPVQKILVFAGRTGLSMWASDKVNEHVQEKIDESVKWVNENFKK